MMLPGFFKIVLFVIVIGLLAGACKKEKKRACQLIAINSFDPGNAPLASSFKYDGEGRFTEIKKYDRTTQFSYYQDSIVVTEKTGNTSNHRITVYFLSAGGMADSSRTRYAETTPYFIAYDQKFTYNSQGYLLSHFIKNEVISNGVVVSDTGTTYFNFEQGDLVQVTYNNQPYKRYSYTNIPAPENIAKMIHPYPYLPFLGKASRHLVSADIDAIGGPVHFSYEFDRRGNLSKVITPVMGAPAPKTDEYIYDCN
jgi:hypothetical protein